MEKIMINKSKRVIIGGILLASCVASAGVLAHGTDSSWCAQNKSQLPTGSAGGCKYYQPGDTMGKSFGGSCTDPTAQQKAEAIANFHTVPTKSCSGETYYCISQTNQALVYQQDTANLQCEPTSQIAPTGNAHVCMSQSGSTGMPGHWANAGSGAYVCANGPAPTN